MYYFSKSSAAVALAYTFLKNHKGYSLETCVMHTSGRVKLKATINNVSCPTSHNSLTLQCLEPRYLSGLRAGLLI